MADVAQLSLSENGRTISPEALKSFYLESKGNPVIVDASGVNFITSLHLQIQIAAEKQWREDGIALEMTNTNEQLQQCFALLGWSSDASN